MPKMRSANHVVVIGGGLAGMSAGITLLQKGRAVTLLEANPRLGGCCATTRVGGFTFNDGAVYVALPELLDAAFERLGMERAARLPLRQITALQTSRVAGGQTVTFRPGGHIRVARAGAAPLRAATEPNPDALRLLQKWRPLLDLLIKDVIVRPFSLPRLLWKGWRELPKLRGTVASELDRMIADPAVRAALGSVTLYTGLPPERTPAMQLIGLVAMLADRFFLPEGGMGAIRDVVAARLAELGGSVRLAAPVERIVVENGRVTGVVVAGHRIAADAVVSTVSAVTTYGSLLPPEHVPVAMRRKAASAPLSQKALSVQLGLHNRIDADSHFMGYLPEMGRLGALLAPDPGDPGWLSYIVPTVTLPGLAANGGSIVEMFPPIDQSVPADRWDPQRAQDVAADAIERLSRLHQIDVAVTRVRSPGDFQRDLRLHEGAIYGLSPVADAGARFPHKGVIEGLYLAGQTTYPGYGVAPAMLSGAFAADMVH